MSDLKLLKITQKRIDILNSMNIYSLNDLIHYYPYRYEVIEETYPSNENDRIIIEAKIIAPAKVFIKGKLSKLTFMVEDRKGQHYNVTIFNRHFIRKYIQLDTFISIIGKLNGHSIVASDIKFKRLNEISGIKPVYTLKEGITSKSLLGYIKKAYKYLYDDIESFVSEKYIMKHKLVHEKTALYMIHFPESLEDIKEALRYLKYREFLEFSLTMQYIKRNREKDVGIKKQIDLKVFQEFVLKLPFVLTEDQNKAIKDIVSDLMSPLMMYRFLQGDVGSGKTVVSALGLYANYLAGYQGALMAPTEILAAQHFETLKKFFKDIDIKICLLTGSLSVKEKNIIYEDLARGEIDIIIGTHALFQKKVIYHNLGFVVTDEQHRFGVEQRKALKNKGKQVDFLIMSATPIPRTLALSLYGDMDVSTIKTMPKGRIPIITQYIHSSSMKPILKHLEEYLSLGGQCYVICPLVEENENIEAKSAKQIAVAMQSYFKNRYHVSLMHGQLKDEQKNDVMNQFLNNQSQILVSTTVVEVGVDVKNANMIVIYNAERFGLSQLHQLRGRVGRGNQQAYCYLMSSSDTLEAKERLQFMENCHDGFELSMYDLKTRGPGEILGNKQSGLPSFVLADIFKDFNIMEASRVDAIEMIEDFEKYDYNKEIIDIIYRKLKENNEYVD